MPDFVNNSENQTRFTGNKWGDLSSSLKIRNETVIDGVDVKSCVCSYNKTTGALSSDNSKKYVKRFPDDIDKGFVNNLRSDKSFSIYRNVNKEATEALKENEGKIVYDYAFGTENITNGEGTASGSTDPSGIDAQASIKNGAHIIYLDTDNSSNDFHQRSQATLKD